MVTTDLIKGAFEAIVTAHNARVAFVPMWVPALDESTETRYPAVWWGPLTSPLKKEQGLSLQKQFVIDMMFLDQTDPSRSQNELLEAHSRMDAIATQVWMRFIQLYVDNAGSFQGVELDPLVCYLGLFVYRSAPCRFPSDRETYIVPLRNAPLYSGCGLTRFCGCLNTCESVRIVQKGFLIRG